MRRGLLTASISSANTSFLFFLLSLKCPVVVARLSLHQVHFGPGYAADGPVPVVPDPHVQISGVEVLEILVEGHKVLHVDGDRRQLGRSIWNSTLFAATFPVSWQKHLWDILSVI